jgi:hypothetical protein
VDNTDGSSLVYAYNPSGTVLLTAQAWSGTNSDGSPTGTELSDVVDNSDGTSIVYAYNPSGTVTLTASFYSGTGSNGAPAGSETQETFDFVSGLTYDSQSVGSMIATYNGNDSTSTQYYSGPDGTGSAVGSPIVSGGNAISASIATTQTSAAGPSATAGAASAATLASPDVSASDTDTIAIAGSNQLIDPGTGNHTIQFAAGATSDTLVPHLSGSDWVLGFDPSAGDMLDLSSVLAEAGVTIGDMSQLANYVSVANSNGSAAIMFDPTGQGGGSQVALLASDGGLVARLQSLKNFVV